MIGPALMPCWLAPYLKTREEMLMELGRQPLNYTPIKFTGVYAYDDEIAPWWTRLKGWVSDRFDAFVSWLHDVIDDGTAERP